MTQYSHDAYEPPQSLWKLVEENVSPGEREEIRDILGMSLVEESLDLQSEVSTLLDIWRDYRDDMEAELAVVPVLPEPPLVRESLCSHIRLLLESLREKAKEEGRDSGISLSKHNSDVIDYAIEDSGSRGCSPGVNNKRPGTAMSGRDGRETPMRMTPCSDSDMLSATSSASDQVESVKDQLNILKIDEVVQELRTTLQDEVDQLKRDISFLHGCLEDESDFRSESRLSTRSEPSLQDLRTEKSILEKELENAKRPSSVGIINSVKTRRRTLPNSPKKLPSQISPSNIRITSPKLRPSPPSSASISRSSPVKASPNVNHTKGNTKVTTVNNEKAISSRGISSRSRETNSHAISTNNNATHKQIDSRTSVLGRVSKSPTGGILRPSPPPPATKPPSGRPGNRFRTRIKDMPQQGATS
ncbi:coiled-coil domain-containing protein 24-like [Amphiura filiformis]|uniref:coiled-coil domain-containing protein 24-like n=1 Tax=Amphiura filiformis TaxID=82378 RepID=UPI003B219BE8